MGLHSGAEMGESSSGSNQAPTLDYSTVKIYISRWQSEKTIQDDLSKDFPQTQDKLIGVFQAIHANSLLFSSDAAAIFQMVTKLLDFYLKCTLPTGCPWQFSTTITTQIKGETQWKTAREMIQHGHMRKGVMSLINDTYYAHLYLNNTLTNAEVMSAPSGMDIRAENHSRITLKEGFHAACLRYLNQQEFLSHLEKLLIESFARLERFDFKDDANINSQKTLIKTIEKLLKEKKWALANQVLRLVSDQEELYKPLCITSIGESPLEETLRKAGAVLFRSEGTIRAYKDLLTTFADKLAKFNRGLGSYGVYFAVSVLPQQFNEQASYFILVDPEVFASCETGINTRWPSRELRILATDRSDRTPTRPDHSILALKFSRKIFLREFKALPHNEKKALLQPFRNEEISLLYRFLTGDFEEGFIKKPFDIHMKNRLWQWHEYPVDLEGVNWDQEFEQKMISQENKASVIHAAQLLTLTGLFQPVYHLMKCINIERQTLLFQAIIENLKNILITLPNVEHAKELVNLMIMLDLERMIELLKALDISKILELLDISQVGVLLQLNSYYHHKNLKNISWDKVMVHLKKNIYNSGKEALASILIGHRNDLEILYMSEITKLIEKNFFMNTQGEKLPEEWWFILLILSEGQVKRFALRPGLSLSLIFKYFMEIFSGNPELKPFEEITLGFCRFTQHESDFTLTNLEQESNRQLMNLLQKSNPAVLHEWIRLSTAHSLGVILEGAIRARLDILNNPNMNQDVIRSLVAKIATMPTHPCSLLLKADENFIRLGAHLFAIAPPPYEEPIALFNPGEYEIARLQHRIQEMEAEYKELYDRHEKLLGKQPMHARQQHDLSEAHIQQLLDAQTIILLENLSSKPERMKELEAENHRLKRSLALKEKLIFSNKFTFNAIETKPSAEQRGRSNSFG